MWTPATRGRMAKIEKKTKRRPSDLTDEEWAKIEPFLPRASKAGRPIEVDLREVLNAIRYMARSGGGWRMLPNDFPPWQTVYWWFRRFVRRFMFQTIHDVALMLDRERVGREASPTGGVVDSRSVKAPEAKTRGYDAGKKVAGRKRHIAVDTDGRLLMVNLTPADISDSAGAQMILDGVRKRWPWLKHLFADGAYDRTQLMDKAAFLDFTIQVVKRSDTAKGFEVIPPRWVRGAHVRLDDPMATSRARLRGAHRLFQSHDPPRSRKPPAQANISRITVFKRTLSGDRVCEEGFDRHPIGDLFPSFEAPRNRR